MDDVNEIKKSYQKTIRIKPETKKLVTEYAEKNHISFSAAIDEVLYNALSSGAENKNNIIARKTADYIINEFEERYDFTINRIASKTKFIDETASAIMEMLNCMCTHAGYQEVPDQHGATYSSARQKVKKDIAKAKERNDNQR